MSFHEVRFPENIDFGFTGGPVYSTDVIELDSGREQRNQNWPLPRMKYTATHTVKDAAQITAINAFFRARKGKAYGFRFRDWTDYLALGQNIGSGDGVATDFQLRKAYVSGGFIEYRPLKKIVAAGNQTLSGTVPQIYLDGVLQVEGIDYTLDYTTGLITFTTPPADGTVITADCEFDVPVRFDTDEMQISHDYGHEFNWQNIVLIELRV